MYAVHTTPGFVIGSKPYGEAGKLLSIFTRDFGLVTATAQGIRLERSKLRYHAQDYSLGEFSLVRGREFWRLTNARPYADFLLPTGVGPEPVIRAALLLRRLLHGEESNPLLFGHVYECTRFLAGNPDLDERQMQAAESLVVFRILDALGYIGDNHDLNGDLLSSVLSVGLLETASGQRIAINKHINTALRESHL
ncbi:MAG: recombination protein O N-terminal domain-containing protein [Patescibacteria group bacterium]|nr:recombination protein O N-terminal domain-containing protein [Patescibacteria group bacterium]